MWGCLMQSFASKVVLLDVLAEGCCFGEMKASWALVIAMAPGI